ncbi:MAG: S-layer homology domain-containing protein [Clostridia bacterium]|nr:S-layer homology domain-containing protein [Clostridia bacterium]
MKKRISALLIALMTVLSGSICSASVSSAGKTEIPDDAGELVFDKEYWIEKGGTAWYKFEAPAPECYLTERTMRRVGDYYYGTAVEDHTLYDENGNDLGKVNETNDPEQGGWTRFKVGGTYYLKIDAARGGTFYSFSPVKSIEPSADPAPERPVGSFRLDLKSTDEYRYIPGETNTLWDVYTVAEEFAFSSANEVYVSHFFITPYNVYFDNASMTADPGRVTYSSVEKTCADNIGTLKSYTGTPRNAGGILTRGNMIAAANLYSYISDPGSGEVSARSEYDVYVPAGKKLAPRGHGVFSAAAVGDIFYDVPGDMWYSGSALRCFENKWMTGMSDHTFSPETQLTRAQFVQILAKLDGAKLSDYEGRQSFTDVPAGKWYSNAVEWAADKNITKGTGGGMFSPDRPVTRQELAVFMRTYAIYKNADVSGSADLSKYTDVPLIADWAREAVSWAVSAGLISGTGDTTLSPASYSTRAQISLIVLRFSENILEPIKPSPMKGRYMLEGDSCGYGIYDEMIWMTGKEKPNVLYIGMASQDPSRYESAQTIFGDARGCEVDRLLLEDLENGNAAKKIEWADLINVGGGDSRMLIARLRKYGTDALLREAAANGTVMTGSSAGAICFCGYGASGVGNNVFLNITATGCVDLEICPHGFEELRVEAMKEFLPSRPGLVGVAVGGCALEIYEGKFRIYSCEDYASTAARYYSLGGEVFSEDINSMEWRPLDELLSSGG